MANSTSGRLWILDTVGIISHNPVWIRKITIKPNAANDAAQINSYQISSPVSAGTAGNKTGTITLTNTLTSTGNLPSDIADGYVFEILKSTGASANVGKWLVKTAGTGDAIVVWDTWTNEASKIYDWTTYPAIQEIRVGAGATDASPVTLDFDPDGIRLPNFILETLSASATLYIYLK